MVEDTDGRESYLRSLSERFEDPSAAYVSIDSIAFVGEELGLPDSVIAAHVANLGRIALNYPGEDQLRALKVLDSVYGRGLDEANARASITAENIDITAVLANRMTAYLLETGSTLNLRGLEHVAEEVILLVQDVEHAPAHTGLTYAQRMKLRLTNS